MASLVRLSFVHLRNQISFIFDRQVPDLCQVSLKSFLASFPALVVFPCWLFSAHWSHPSKSRPVVEQGRFWWWTSGQHSERRTDAAQSAGCFASSEEDAGTGHDVVRLIQRATTDHKRIAGIYLISNNNPNGFAASGEIRKRCRLLEDRRGNLSSPR